MGGIRLASSGKTGYRSPVVVDRIVTGSYRPGAGKTSAFAVKLSSSVIKTSEQNKGILRIITSVDFQLLNNNLRNEMDINKRNLLQMALE
jgi:hypothetical protein